MLSFKTWLRPTQPRIHLAFAVACSLLASGCALQLHKFLPEKVIPEVGIDQSLPPTTRWQQRKNSLKTLTRWQASGKIAIRKANTNGWSGSAHWDQISPTQYRILLLAPIGGGVKLERSGQQVQLQNNKGQIITASSAEQIIFQQLGLRLPVSNLYFWIRGIPAPGPVFLRKLDAAARLQKLQQQGWQIDYQEYQQRGRWALPSRILLTEPQHGWAIKLFIQSWRF